MSVCGCVCVIVSVYVGVCVCWFNLSVLRAHVHFRL